MSILQRARDAVRNSEEQLRQLIAEAAQSGDYSSIELIARWASAIREILPNDSVAAGNSPAPLESPAPVGVVAEPSPNAAPIPVKRASKRRSYPAFAKSGDSLVKIAWSKSTKSEYQHKSPWWVTRKLAEKLGSQGKSGAIVAMDKVLPLKADDGSEVPDYQAYVSLAWLRSMGVVKQNGRQGYTIKKASELTKTVEAAWSQLAEVKPS